MTKNVLILRGIPGSGKTTWAKTYMSQLPEGFVARINNDEIVDMTFGKSWRRQEGIADALRKIREALLKELLLTSTVHEVIVDNTNLSVKTVAGLQKVAHRYGANVVVLDDFLKISVESCIERDALRESPVGEAVIRKMHKEASRLKPWDEGNFEPVVEPYDNHPGRPGCFVVDIDGTLALATSRGPYDLDKVLTDEVNYPVANLVRLIQEGSRSEIIYLSGRKDSSLRDTQTWLYKNGLLGPSCDGTLPQLYMRSADDNRPDYIVKNELFQRHIAGKYTVLGVFDDRDQVVDLWRNKLGLPTFQVANGDF
jgi:predicted kinase